MSVSEPLFKPGDLAFIATEMNNPAIPRPLTGHVLKYNSVVEVTRVWQLEDFEVEYRYDVLAFSHSVRRRNVQPKIGETRNLKQSVLERDLSRHKIPFNKSIQPTLPDI